MIVPLESQHRSLTILKEVTMEPRSEGWLEINEDAQAMGLVQGQCKDPRPVVPMRSCGCNREVVVDTGLEGPRGPCSGWLPWSKNSRNPWKHLSQEIIGQTCLFEGSWKSGEEKELEGGKTDVRTAWISEQPESQYAMVTCSPATLMLP